MPVSVRGHWHPAAHSEEIAGDGEGGRVASKQPSGEPECRGTAYWDSWRRWAVAHVREPTLPLCDSLLVW